jgi:hypothetical protein
MDLLADGSQPVANEGVRKSRFCGDIQGVALVDPFRLMTVNDMQLAHSFKPLFAHQSLTRIPW